MLILSRTDLERLLTPASVIEALDHAFRLHAEGRCRVPPRVSMPAGSDGVLLVMPAVMAGAGRDGLDGEAGGERAAGARGAGGGSALGTKLVTVYAGNRARGEPTVHASYVLMDGETGRPLALVEGTFLTGMRTGAASALAARYLARADAGAVACFGAGVQAGFQLRCLAAVRRLERVVVVGRDPRRARGFAEAMGAELGVAVEVASDPRRAVREADIVTCATTSAVPVVAGAELRPGSHVDLVGAFRPTDREADDDVVRRARVVVDTYAGALEEAGDVVIPLTEGTIDRRRIVAELAELCTGQRAGRTRDDDITVFKSVGFALEDVAAARLAYVRARAARVGTEVSL